MPLVALALALALVATACADDGRELRPPPPGVTAPPPPTAAPPPTAPSFAEASAVTGPDGFALRSPAVTPGEALPLVHTCDGGNVSPPLAWTDPPAGTVELALVVLDATGFVHWAVAGIDPGAAAVAAGETPDGLVAANGIGEFDYHGPCPLTEAPEVYAFVLFALTTPSRAVPGTDGAALVAELEGAASWRSSFAVTAAGGAVAG